MTGAWGRVLAQYGQSITLRRGEEEWGCRAFLQPVRERRGDWYQELPTPLGMVRRDQWLYLGPPELPLEEANSLCTEQNGLRFAVRAAQPVYVGEETLYQWALLAVEDGKAQTEQTRGGKHLDFQVVREQMAAFLRQQGVDTVYACPGGRQQQRSGPVAAVSLRACQGRPGDFWDYLGGQYDENTGQQQELYGRRATLTFGLDLYGESAREPQTAYGRMAETFQWEGPAGLALRELSCGEAESDRAADLYRRTVTTVCQGYLHTVADEDGTFPDFTVRREGRL